MLNMSCNAFRWTSPTFPGPCRGSTCPAFQSNYASSYLFTLLANTTSAGKNVCRKFPNEKKEISSMRNYRIAYSFIIYGCCKYPSYAFLHVQISGKKAVLQYATALIVENLLFVWCSLRYISQQSLISILYEFIISII